MVRFRDLRGQPPAVDLQRLAENVRRVAELEKGLDATIAQLAIDMPGNAEAVAAAGISFRAQINRSASMIELGTAAVDALRRADWILTSPPSPAQRDDARPEPELLIDGYEEKIPDDWAV